MTHDLKTTISRRDVLMTALKGTVGASLAVTARVSAGEASSPTTHLPEFIPENDYPFFGCELPDDWPVH